MKTIHYILQKKWLLSFCLFGFAINLIAYYPGFMTADTLDQYGQSLSGNYNDWHPPIMALLWSVLNKISSGPQSLLIFQLSLFWICAFLLIDALPGLLWKALAALVMLAPFIQNFAGYIIKDTEMALTWILAFTLMLRISRRESKITPAEWIICLALLLYGTMVRTNALPGVIPLCFMLSYAAYKNKPTRTILAGGIALAVFIAGAQLIIYQGIVKPVKTHPEDKLFLHDLSGLFVKTHQNVFPSILYTYPGFDTAYIRKNYTTATFDDILENQDKIMLIDPDQEITHDLYQSWIGGISKYPLIYLSNRFDGFLYYLRIKNRREFNYYIYYIEPNPYGFVLKPNRIAHFITEHIQRQGDRFYMKPWFWLLLNIALFFFIPVIQDKTHKTGYSLLISSSLLYLLPGFFIYPTDTDFRYFYWNCIACSIAFCILMVSLKPKTHHKP